MKVQPSEILDVLIIDPRVFRDERGFFLESFSARRYEEAGMPGPFIQDNHSSSMADTLRGLHTQREFPQAKLVRAISGSIWDVAVDIRRGSPTFGRWVGVELSAENCRQIYVPEGFAHGFCVLSERAEIEYKVNEYYHPEDELGIAWNDPDIAIDWPTDSPVLSQKDRDALPLSAVLDLLPEFQSES